jgi:hypothetical protein
MKRSVRAELETLEKMLQLYCRAAHGGRPLCAGCRELLAYSSERLRLCPHDPKPACKDCTVHCYSPVMRARIREVMRYAGPRMALRHPLLALRHLLGI